MRVPCLGCAAGREAPLNVFVQVNTSEEPQKGGVAPDACIDLVKHVRSECPQLSFAGLMTIGKLGEVAAKYFEVRHKRHSGGASPVACTLTRWWCPSPLTTRADVGGVP